MQALIYQKVPMSDGIRLATDVYMPDGPGPFPTLLIRSPYHRSGKGLQYVEEGYNYIKITPKDSMYVVELKVVAVKED